MNVAMIGLVQLKGKEKGNNTVTRKAGEARCMVFCPLTSYSHELPESPDIKREKKTGETHPSED